MNKNKKLIYVGEETSSFSKDRTYVSRGETKNMYYVTNNNGVSRYYSKNLFVRIDNKKS